MTRVHRFTWALGLGAALALGAAFRFAWPGDVEYKADEAWTYDLVRRFVERGDGSWLGMPSSQNLHNPGLSLWVFYPLGALFGTAEPTGLARGVQILNVAAVLALAAFAWRCVPSPRREAWLWAAALVAVNPLAVLFHRKIWPPCTLPLVLVGLLAGWWHRDRRGGAFLWGLLTAAVAQVHLAGVFHAAALAVWTRLFDRRPVAWRWWLFGLSVGSYPLVPWVDYLLSTRHDVRPDAVEWARLLELKFYTHWLTEPFGLGLKYALGPDFADFLAGPVVAGRPTYGVAAVHGLLILTGAGLVVAGARRWWPARRDWRGWLGGGGDSTSLVLTAMMWGYGLLLTATRLPFYRQYLLLTFPVPALWVAQLALPDAADGRARARGRTVLLALVVGQVLVTAAFLAYVHAHGGTPRGDYGRSYAAQVETGEVMTPP
jgi:hypothetical protein